MSTLVYLTTILFVLALALSIMYYVNLGSTVRSCPWSMLVVKKSSLRSKLMLLLPIWCICFLVSRLMIFPFFPSLLLCMAIFLICLIIPLTLSTLSIMPSVGLPNCPLRKSKSTIMTIVCGFLSCLLLTLLLPWLMILNVLSLIWM